MPVRLLHGVEIDAPAVEVWQAFCRIADWPRWFPALTHVTRATQGPFVVGEELALGLAFRGRGTTVRVKVTSAGVHEVRWIGRSFGVTGDHAFRAEPLGEHRARFVSEELFSGLPVRLLPRSIFSELEQETVAGLARFRALVRA